MDYFHMNRFHSYFPSYELPESPDDLLFCNLKVCSELLPEIRFTRSNCLNKFVTLFLLSMQTVLFCYSHTSGSSANVNYPCEKSAMHLLQKENIFTWYIKKWGATAEIVKT